MQSIGVKAEEIISYTQSHNLMVSVTICMIALCVLEIGAYMLYNREVSRSILIYINKRLPSVLYVMNLIFSFILG